MSVVLYPGDKVHVVIPGVSNRDGTPDTAANFRFEQQVIDIYAAQGVEAVLRTVITSSSVPMPPAVVAIFRKQPADG